MVRCAEPAVMAPETLAGLINEPVTIAGDGVRVYNDVFSELLGEKAELLTRISSPSAANIGFLASVEQAAGNYLDVDIDRDAISRYGIDIDEVQAVIMSAIGGMNVSQTVEGLERYPINVRYPRELRDNMEQLKRVLIPTPAGQQIPLSLVAEINTRRGPPVIKSEDAQLVGYVFVDVVDRDIGSFVAEGQRHIAEAVDLPLAELHDRFAARGRDREHAHRPQHYDEQRARRRRELEAAKILIRLHDLFRRIRRIVRRILEMPARHENTFALQAIVEFPTKRPIEYLANLLACRTEKHRQRDDR